MSEVDVPGGAFGPVRPRPADWKQNWPWAWRSGPAASAARRLTHPRLVAPLSLAQQRLWMLEQLHPGSALGNLPVAVRLRGALDRWALEQALAAVLERHQSLRTRFQSRDGEPWQEVWGAPVLALPLEDLSEPERQLPERLADQIGRPFNLSAEVLLRAALFRLAPQEHVLLVNLHHLVADACSCELLLEEVCRRYGAIVTGVPAPLPELPLQYTDYVAWEREELKRPPMQAHLAWWQQQLAGVPDLLELPTDRPRPVVASFRGERRELTLGEELTTGLRQLSRREGVSLGVLLQTAFHLLLHRLTGQADLVVGMPSSGRHRVEAERLIGLFVNPLALRSRLAGNPTFPELLHETQRTQLAALAHQALPFDRLVQELRLERSASHAPLLQTMFTFQGVPQRPLSWPGLTATRLNVHPGTAKHELTLAVSETPQNLIAELEYSAELFEGATMKRWLAHYQRLLAGIAATPEQRVRDLPLLGEAERHRLLVEWNQTRTPYPRRQCVHELFEAQAQARAEAVAVEFGQQQLTYGELDARASQLAQHLHQAGVGPGAPVAVAVERSLELIITLLAILKAGGAYAALDLASPRGRWQQILEDLRPPVLLTHSALLDRLPETCANLTGQAAPLVICIDAEAEAIRRQSMASPEVQVSAESLAYVSYTSGSTGRPKGVCVPHRAVVRLVKGTDYARFAPDEVFLHLSPVAFDASTFEIWGCLLNGARLVVAPPELPSLSDLADTLRQHQVTTAWFTTGLFNQMVDLQLDGMKPLRQLLTGGDVLSPPHVQLARARLEHCRLINGYGPTENTTFSTTYTIPTGYDGQRSVPIGRPIANSQCYVFDEQLQPVPIGIAGELYVGGDGLALEYLNQPELTAERFIAHPFEPGARLYKTGDRVRYLADGNLEFLGRLDQQVKVRGFRVEIGEIEAALLEHPAVAQCVVVPRTEASGSKQLVAYVVPRHEAPAVEDLRENLQRKLPDYMMPTFIVVLAALPLTPNGKVDRRQLPAPQAGAALAPEVARPRDELERQLQALWEELLPARPIGRADSFFALGGHSLLAMRLLARMERIFGKRLPVARLFQHPTIEQLAVALRGQQAPGVSCSLVEVQGQGSRPPLMLVHGAGGGLLWGYSNLAQHLGPEQPVFAFRSRGLDGLEEWDSIEAMAEAYLVDLRVFQPAGPYYLGGFCFGGLVAYEMACRLQALGQRVALLVLMNASAPQPRYARCRWTPRWAGRFAGNFWRRTLAGARMHPAGLFSFCHQKLRRWATPLHSGAPQRPVRFDEWMDLADYPEDQRRVWQRHARAARQYHPRPYAGRVALAHNALHPLFSSFDPEYGWGELVQGGLSVRVFPGTHETLLEEPQVQEVAAALRQWLKEAQSEEGLPWRGI